MEGKPFVLLGVNSDSDKGKLRKRMKEENITWRSWWDGATPTAPSPTSSTSICGRATTSWTTAGSSATSGRISPAREAFDAAIDKLVAAAQDDAKKAP